MLRTLTVIKIPIKFRNKDLFMEIIVDYHTVQVSSVPVLHTERINIEIYYKYDFMRFFIFFKRMWTNLLTVREHTLWCFKIEC